MLNRKGFTLIELLIVVVIIGILAAIAIPKFAATKDKAKLASVKSDLRNLETAEESYFSDNNQYIAPGSLATNIFVPSAGNSVGGAVVGTSGYTAIISNSSITSGSTSCTVNVGGGASNDGVITC
ncbi:MAG TPA: prepilin-type N-terminal cleavage/methylation domain-containing protein [Gemmatimonadales bacterium]|nr:prepilin-type N-terminal cleavage/methylation domain-containing protein [Gemmatimonadales bacterium]